MKCMKGVSITRKVLLDLRSFYVVNVRNISDLHISYVCHKVTSKTQPYQYIVRLLTYPSRHVLDACRIYFIGAYIEDTLIQ